MLEKACLLILMAPCGADVVMLALKKVSGVTRALQVKFEVELMETQLKSTKEGKGLGLEWGLLNPTFLLAHCSRGGGFRPNPHANGPPQNFVQGKGQPLIP